MSHTHTNKDKKMCPGGKYSVPSYIDLHSVYVNNKTEKVFSPTRIFTYRFNNKKTPIKKMSFKQLFLYLLKNENMYCSGKISYGEWLNNARNAGFIIHILKK
jgi:hypothetical protein